MVRPAHALLVAALVFNTFFSGAAARAAAIAPAPKALESFDSGMLHADRYGHGSKTLIFIPGLSSGTWTWNEQIAHFAPAYTVYALTLPGFDGRPPVAQSDLFGAFSQDFWAMLDARHIQKPVVIGHSLGGTLAILLGEEHSDRLGAIVAVDGLPVFPMVAQSTPEARAAMAKTAATQIESLDRAQQTAYETNFMATIGTTDKAFAPALGALAAKSDPKAVAAWMTADLTTDLRPNLSKIAVPFIEVMPYASPSPYSQGDTAAFYASLLAGASTAKVVPITPARHYAMLDQPQQFDAALTQFLSLLR